MEALPEVGRTMVQSMPIVVVLPAPLGPRRPKISPFSIFRSMPRTACILPKVFASARVSIIDIFARPEPAGFKKVFEPVPNNYLYGAPIVLMSGWKLYGQVVAEGARCRIDAGLAGSADGGPGRGGGADKVLRWGGGHHHGFPRQGGREPLGRGRAAFRPRRFVCLPGRRGPAGGRRQQAGHDRLQRPPWFDGLDRGRRRRAARPEAPK